MREAANTTQQEVIGRPRRHIGWIDAGHDVHRIAIPDQR